MGLSLATLKRHVGEADTLPELAQAGPGNRAAVAIHRLAVTCACSLGSTWAANGRDIAAGLDRLQRDIARAFEDGAEQMRAAEAAAGRESEGEVPRG